MAAYNANLAPVPYGQPPAPTYGQPQAGYGGENTFPGYSSGYANYGHAATQYPGQWNAGSGGYPAQGGGYPAQGGGYPAQGGGQAAVGYDVTGYQQGMAGAGGGYGYENQNFSSGSQGYSYGGQGYPAQTFAAAGNQGAAPGVWDPNQSAWSGATGGGDQGHGGFGQPGGLGNGYQRGGGVAGRGDAGGMGADGGKPPGGYAEVPGRGRGFGDRKQEFGSDGSYPRGGGAVGRGRGNNLGSGGAPWYGGGQAPGGGTALGLGDQGLAPRGRGGFPDRGRGAPERGQSWSSRGGTTSGHGIGRGESSFGRGHSDVGRGGGDRGREAPGGGGWGVSERGRGASDRGLGGGMSSDRGRGGGDRGSSFGRGVGDGGSSFGRGGGDRGSSFGRGGGGDRGSSFGRGGGDRESSFGRGGGDRGRGGGDSGSSFGRGGGDRGRGGRDPGSSFGRGGGDRGRGGGDRGSSFGRGGGDRGRGGGDRGRGGGRGGGDRGRGGGDRGSSFGRGGGDRGRGGGDRGRGGSGRPQASDGGGSYGSKSKTFLTSGSGVGLSSLGDVIKSAKSRQFSKAEVQPCTANDSLTKLVEHWQHFTRTFTDCGNAITTMECSLTASKVRFIRLYYTARSLTQCHSYCIFTGSLYLNKVSENQSEDGIFLARGLGLTKKNAKLDAYQKAYHLLMNATVAEIMSQEDTNDHALIEEVTCLFNEDPDGFMALLKKSNTEGEGGTQAMVDASMKRPATGGNGPNFPAKRARMSQEVANMLEASSTSLVPKKQTELVMSPLDPLLDKLKRLKELLKEEGITKLHIVPKIDQLGNKTALNIRNVYRFFHPPMRGVENETPVFCEIFFDNVLMSTGDAAVKRTAAMHSAYTLLAERLCKEPLDSIVHCSSYWKEFMASDPDVCQVILKRAGEDNDSLLTTNLANMKQMMQSNPNFSNSIDRFVLMEFEADTRMENSYKMLELSATRNCMLLECEIVRNQEQRFTCMISMQGRQLSIRTSSTKNGAKRLCSDAILNRLNRTNDIVFVGKGVQGPIFTRTQLLEEAKKAKEAGTEPLKCNLKKEDVKVPPFKTNEQEARWEEDRRKAKEIDNLLENLVDRPFIPWMGRILADRILDYHKRVTLEDLRVHLHDMPKSMRDMVQIVSSRLGLRTVSKLRDGENAILRRSIPALEVTKILGVNNGESGRFRLKQCKNPWSAKELEDYKNEIIAKYTKMYDELLSDTDTETEPKIEN